MNQPLPFVLNNEIFDDFVIRKILEQSYLGIEGFAVSLGLKPFLGGRIMECGVARESDLSRHKGFCQRETALHMRFRCDDDHVVDLLKMEFALDLNSTVEHIFLGRARLI